MLSVLGGGGRLAAADDNGSYWNTLGVARYRAGDWKGAVAALEKSMPLRRGGDAFDWFFLAMSHWQLGNKDDARRWYDRGAREVQQPPGDKPARPWGEVQANELRAFRAEAAALLGVKD